MKAPLIISALVAVAALGGSSLFVEHSVRSARTRLESPEIAAEQQAKAAPVADHTDAEYCTPEFRKVLSRVVDACGLSGQDARRGCEPVDVRTFASISDEDFNALFMPLEKRGGIVLFDDNSDKLDKAAEELIREKWEERRGARYFFIVARASKSGTQEYNLTLSQRRANSVFLELEKAGGSELEKQVGMLWLGSQYAQLSTDYCASWSHSRKGKKCDDSAINRSAFVSWVDCRL